MGQAVPTDFSAPSFAGLLAALTAPRKPKQPAAASGLDASGFAATGSPDPVDPFQDDVVTLSYESALKTHARYRQAHECPPPQSAATATAFDNAGDPRASSSVAVPERPAQTASAAAAIAAASRLGNDLEQSRKRASVTLRMSNAECARLQQRAAEAGMTVSAYLRSCAFEVESLRAQVKQTLAELRAAQTAKPPQPARRGQAERKTERKTARKTGRRTWREYWLRFFHRPAALADAGMQA